MEESVTTAVSMPKRLFLRAEELAKAMNISPSELVSLALLDYLRREEQLRLLERLNTAYADTPNDEERRWLDVAPELIAENDPDDKW